MNIDDVANELYAVPADEFTAARKAQVTEARTSGDLQLAKAIGELRRPTASAAIVNLLMRRRQDLLNDLLDLADELRQAQAALAGGDLRRLSARRHELVSALVDEGRQLAAQRQHSLTAQVESELTSTLQAALADPAAAEAVRSGRLTSALHYSGFGMFSGVGEAQSPGRRAKPSAEHRRAATAAPRVADGSRREALAAATEALDAAQGRLDELEQAASSADEAVTSVMRLRIRTRRAEVIRGISVGRPFEGADRGRPDSQAR